MPDTSPQEPRASTDSRTDNSARRISRGPVVVLIVGAALALGLVLLGAALAGTPTPTPPASQRPGTDAAPRDVNVIMRDYHFDPTPLYLYPGETIRLNVFNGGMVEHELVLGDATVQDAWAEEDAVNTPPAPFATTPPATVDPGVGGLRILLASGGSTSVLYHVPDMGTLQMLCHLPGHLEQGMAADVVLVTPEDR
ncbi:MAG TPA: hypothetical protein VH371_11830 [Candidatus Limnocylindrales bacterium]